MKNREYHVGPGAVSLLLVIVVVSMSVLGLLSLISARGEYNLTKRAALLARSEHETAAQSEYALAQLDALLLESGAACEDDEAYLASVAAALPEGMQLSGRTVTWTEQGENGRALLCSAEILPLGSSVRCRWTEHSFISAENDGYDEMNFDVWE